MKTYDKFYYWSSKLPIIQSCESDGPEVDHNYSFPLDSISMIQLYNLIIKGLYYFDSQSIMKDSSYHLHKLLAAYDLRKCTSDFDPASCNCNNWRGFRQIAT